MTLYTAVTILICLSALFAYINHRFLKLPFVIGIFLLSTVLSLAVISSRFWLDIPVEEIKQYIEKAEINKIILDYLLGFLLFAGALQTNWSKLKEQIRPIATFALGGVFLSTVIISLLFYSLTLLFNVQIDYIYCLIFGALISPTDPIAVLGILSKMDVPKKTESTIVGESLFNDGVGVVIFISLLEVLNSGEFSLSNFSILFVQEAVGGIIMGFGLGYLLYTLMKSIDHYETEILLTLAFVMAGYSFCNYLHLSGALSMVVMGLIVGNFKPEKSMSDVTQKYVHKFWELLDVILNAVLFIIIAFVLIQIEFKANYFIIGLLCVFIVLFARIVVVFLPHLVYPKLLKLTNQEAKIITWGGLRGGLSLALVLSLPENGTKNILLIATYCCVLFSIVVQGLTIEKLAKK